MAVSVADPRWTACLPGPGRAGGCPGQGRAGFLLAEVLVALVLLGVGISGALLLLIQASRTMHRADRLAGAVPFVAALAETGPVDPEGTAEVSVGDGPPVRLDWWWEDGALVVHHHLPGEDALVGRRIPIHWFDDGIAMESDAPRWGPGG